MERTSQRIAALLLAGFLAGVPASAEEACDRLFPDFTCDRSGRFEGFERPIVQPYLFEDPFITTGAYPYYIWHQFPKDSALEGGSAHVLAAQLRVAVTDRFAIIATKDGYMWKDPDNPLLKETGGWMNLAFGAKYAIYQDRDAGRIVSLVLKYEAPSGAEDTFQGEGDGMLMPAITGAARFGNLALQADLGGIWAIDDSQSSSLTYHLYFGYPVLERLTPFLQFSGIHWTDGGDGSRLVELSSFGQSVVGVQKIPISVVESIYGSFEGADVANVGAEGAEGLDLVTVAFGLQWRLTDLISVGAAYELPVTDYEGIFDQRITTNLSLEF